MLRTVLVATTLLASPAAAQVTITCLTNAGHLTRQHEPLVERFNAMQDEVEVVYAAPAADYSDTHLRLFRASATDTLPDCAFTAYNQLPSLARALAERGQIADLGPLMEAEGDGWTEENYTGQMLDLGRVDGVQYGMPFNASMIQWYYNADLFREAGLDPDAFPTDWEGFFAATKALDALDGDVIPMAKWLVGGDDWGFQTLILQQGGRMMSEDGQAVAFDEEDRHVEALRMARRFVTDGGYAVDLDWDTQTTAFTEGRLGIYGSSPAGAARVAERVGDAFDLRSTPYTVWNEEAGLLPTGGNAAVIFGDDPERVAATWEWVKFVTGPEGQDFVSKATGYLPTNQGALAPELLGDYYEEDPYYATPSEQYDRAGPWSGYPGTQSEKIWRDQRDVIRAVMEGELSPEEGAPQLVEIAEELMQR